MASEATGVTGTAEPSRLRWRAAGDSSTASYPAVARETRRVGSARHCRWWTRARDARRRGTSPDRRRGRAWPDDGFGSVSHRAPTGPRSGLDRPAPGRNPGTSCCTAVRAAPRSSGSVVSMVGHPCAVAELYCGSRSRYRPGSLCRGERSRSNASSPDASAASTTRSDDAGQWPWAGEHSPVSPASVSEPPASSRARSRRSSRHRAVAGRRPQTTPLGTGASPRASRWRTSRAVAGETPARPGPALPIDAGTTIPSRLPKKSME